MFCFYNVNIISLIKVLIFSHVNFDINKVFLYHLRSRILTDFIKTVFETVSYFEVVHHKFEIVIVISHLCASPPSVIDVTQQLS